MSRRKKPLLVISLSILCSLLLGSTAPGPARAAAPSAALDPGMSGVADDSALAPTGGCNKFGVDLAPVKLHLKVLPPTPIDNSMAAVNGLGFCYAQYYLSWRLVEPYANDVILWNWLDPVVNSAEAHNVMLVFRIYDTPKWAATAPGAPTPANVVELGRFMEALVQHFDTRVAGYVIWNEPNTPAGWEGHTPSAAAYVSMLREAYKGAKHANPAARIVSAGLAPTLGGGGAVNDLTFLDQMYAAGLMNVVDVVGMDGFGFNHPPEDTSDLSDLNFLRLARLHDVMIENGDTLHKAWALEVGWVAYTTRSLPGFNAYKVSEGLQARYLKRALQIANGWSWMSAIFIWNLNFPRDLNEPEKEFFAIQDRLAYHCVKVGSPAVCPVMTYLPVLLKY